MLAIIDNDLRKHLEWKCIKALAFVPVDQIDAAYQDLLQDPGFETAFWDPFLAYLEEWYIGAALRGGGRGNGRIPKAVWNVYEAARGGKIFPFYFIFKSL